MNLKLGTNDHLSVIASEGLAGIFVNAQPLSISLSNLLSAAINSTISVKADLSSIEHVVQYEQDYAEDYTAVTIGSRFEEIANNIGQYSVVNGLSCAAFGQYSHAEGFQTSATSYAHTEGYQTRAAEYSSHAEGSNTLADNDSAHAEGYQTSAYGMWSHSEGQNTYTENHASHAEGSYTSALMEASHSEGSTTIANNEGAHAEGGQTSAFGYYSHTEGGWTKTGEYAIGAHAEGGFTRADGPVSHVEGIKATSEISDFQSFVWQGTDYMPQNVEDINPADWDEYKAHGPGTFNINPVSGLSGFYIGETRLADVVGNADHLELIEYSDLVDLRDTSALVPGMKYRIIDFVTTVDQEDCRSAGHPFDLVVTALDSYTLDEKAIATLPSNGDDYFDARPFHLTAYQDYLEYKRVPLESWEIKYCLDNDKTRFAWADEENGKGVIWYMKDEFNNEAPYDFKNVQFKRYEITAIIDWDEEKFGTHDLIGTYGLPNDLIEVDTENSVWCYTFNGIDYQDSGFSEPYDFSGWHVRPTQAVLQQLETSIERLQVCYENTIQAENQDDFSLMSFKLPNNVFQCALTEIIDNESPFLKIGYCVNNKFGINCIDNTIGDNSNNNLFNGFCNYNTFCSYCEHNVFNSAYCNIFGNTCQDNTFYSYCEFNIFGNACCNNTFSFNCNNNIFCNDCFCNIFSNGCYNNIFDYSCSDNKFGNSCNNNTFGSECESNIFGSNCCNNTFGNNCNCNNIGNSCYYIKFGSSSSVTSATAKSYCRYINIASGNQYIVLNATGTTSNSSFYQNVEIKPGVNNTDTYKTITDANVGQTFTTTYQPANSQVISI